MPKDYKEELAAWVKKDEASSSKQDKNLMTFLAVRADVKAAIGSSYAEQITMALEQNGSLKTLAFNAIPKKWPCMIVQSTWIC